MWRMQVCNPLIVYSHYHSSYPGRLFPSPVLPTSYTCTTPDCLSSLFIGCLSYRVSDACTLKEISLYPHRRKIVTLVMGPLSGLPVFGPNFFKMDWPASMWKNVGTGEQYILTSHMHVPLWVLQCHTYCA